ncbi:hypothetical protein SDC9_70697 [bioreactor metagenome]|uniref:Phospholipase C/D domain-containing protein n=1 Tax=bioreactor metagenome TaxID=1076179 RepID=A0A644Y6N2_9ZZZZ
MPSIITHTLMAEKTLQELPTGPLKEAINANKEAFLLGANGPDYLYFYNALPWTDQKIRNDFTCLANEVHSSHINDFYHLALKLISNQNDHEIRLAMLAYLAGHLCHWALDCTAHPFIFYRTDGTTPETKYWHYRYEAMIDTYMLDYYKKEELIDLPQASLITYSDFTIQAIADLYGPIVSEIWNFDLDEHQVTKAFKDFHSILMLTYDPVGIWFSIIQLFETIKKDKWSFTGHFITLNKDDAKDILNLTRQKWANPCDCSRVHHDSFIELFRESLYLGNKTLQTLENCLETGRSAKLLTLIDNRSYDTGYSELRSMKYFDPIY